MRMQRAGAWFGAAALCALGAAGLYAWLKTPYVPAEAREASDAFLERLAREDRAGARALTDGGWGMGRDAQGFDARLAQALNGRTVARPRFESVSSPMSKGYVLRHRLRGERVVPEQIVFEYVGPCLLQVRVRPAAQGAWRVSYVQCHAG